MKREKSFKSKFDRIFSNKIKFISAVTLYIISFVVLLASQFVYMFHYAEYEGVIISGSPYLPEYHIEYKLYIDQVYKSVQFSCIVFAFGLISATYKHPSSSFINMSFAAYVGFVCSGVKSKCDEFNKLIEENHTKVCVDGVVAPSLEHQFNVLVHQWMCTSDCKCYQGENNEIKELWTGYGDEVLFPYYRNDIDTYELNEQGNYTYPFIWTDDPDEAINTFKECYDKVLKPKKKYIPSLDEYVKSFYEDGGMFFLMKLETQHETCASICQLPLFYLTKDISLGMPESECIVEQIEESTSHANAASSICQLLGFAIWGVAIMNIPIFFGYHKLEDNAYKNRMAATSDERDDTEQEQGSMELGYVRNNNQDSSEQNDQSSSK